MKTPRSKLSMIVVLSGFTLLLLPISQPAQAGGGGSSGVGGGGNAVILPDDTVILQDPYATTAADGVTSRYLDFNPLIQAEIERISFLMVRLGAAVDDSTPLVFKEEIAANILKARSLSRTAESKFVVDRIKNSHVDYRFVDEIPADCAFTETQENGPQNSTVVHVGCTTGWITWLKKSLFVRMSVREQSKLIVHERLHTLTNFGNLEYIADFTSDLEVALSLFNQQIAGQRPVLTSDQLRRMNQLVERISQMEEFKIAEDSHEFNDHWKVSPNGGGLFHRNSQLSASAYLGVGSLLGEGGSLADGSQMIVSGCYMGACTLRAGASLYDSTLFPDVPSAISLHEALAGQSYEVLLQKNAQINSSEITVNAEPTRRLLAITVGEGSKIEKSSFSGFHDLFLDSNAQISQCALNVSGPGRAIPKLILEAGARLKNASAFIFAGAELPDRHAVSLTVPKNTEVNLEQIPACTKNLFVLLVQTVLFKDQQTLKNLCTNPKDFPQPGRQ